VVGYATRARRHQCRAGAGAAGDAADTGGLEGCGEAHHGQDGGQPARLYREVLASGELSMKWLSHKGVHVFLPQIFQKITLNSVHPQLDPPA